MAYAGKSGEVRGIRVVAKSPSPRSLTTTEQPSRNNGTLLTGIAIGVVIGAGIALLLAPRSGADTRYQIGRGLKRVRRRGRDAWDDLRDELSQARRSLMRATRKEEAGRRKEAL